MHQVNCIERLLVNTSVKSKFPALINDPTLVYVDNASTTQRPESVINAVKDFEEKGVANIHRGLYSLAENASRQYEIAREKAAQFINAENKTCIAFSKGTTESINTVAFGFLKHQLKVGDEVIVSAMEHHANLIPWQQVCKERKAFLKIIPVDRNGDLVLNEFTKLLNSKTKLIAVTHISNTLGTINPIDKIIEKAHKESIPVLVDAAQSVTHQQIDVQKWNADFIAFSAHKMFGPFGVGVLYVNPKFHEMMNPFVFGGGAVKNVTFEETEWLGFPANIEAGTSNISGVIGFSAALDFATSLNWNSAAEHQYERGEKLREGIKQLQGFHLAGNARKMGGIVSFFHDHIHPHDIASFLDSRNIAVRAGHHCTQPLLDALGIPATVRVSFSIYNTNEDVEKILDALKDVNKFWS